MKENSPSVSAAAGEADDAWASRFRPHRFALILTVVVIAAWGLMMASALRGAALGPEASGVVMAVFPPSLADHEAYRAITNAGGGVLEKSIFANAWIARSKEPGFVGRLLEGGAWRAFEADSIQPLLVVGCFTTPASRFTN